MAMRIEAVDFFYLSMPDVRDVADGSQDALLVRVQAGDYVGWGECEASPLVSIAALVCPMSHRTCKPVRDSVLGQRLESPRDIARIGSEVRANSVDLPQADHTLSGIDVALWDLMGKRMDEPIYRLLGYPKAHPKVPYASVRFGDLPQETLAKARLMVQEGYRAVKFGWGPFGRQSLQADSDQLAAAREGLGPEGILLVDAGAVWAEDLHAALQRVEPLLKVNALWLEEPFVTGALAAYSALAAESGRLRLAGGEGCHNFHMARQMLDHAGLGYIQIDTGRIGGISAAKQVADYAHGLGVTYVNHTFTSHLQLSAALQPYAGLSDDVLCEYPEELQPLAWELTRNHLLTDGKGNVFIPEAPGHGMEPDVAALRKYLVEAEITVQGKTLYKTPPL
jgi:L-alanine-DL-glutamate epimerase-like enolase superfamily enzyme